MKELLSTNVVIVARDLNPSLFSQIWLDKHDIIKEEEFSDKSVFTPPIIQALTDDFQLLVIPERLQLTIINKQINDSELVMDKVGKIVQLIPHTPFTAIGSNFHWKIIPDLPEEFIDFMNKLFIKPENPLYKQFAEENARFGAYLSKDIFGTRLKLDIKPVRNKIDDSEYLQFTFNYHLELTDGEHIDQMLDFLKNWELMKKNSEEITSIALMGN
jgi:hypothetical protein